METNKMQSRELKSLKKSKDFLENTLSGCVDRYVYGRTIAAMREAISVLEAHSCSVSRKKALKASKHLKKEADFLEIIVSACPNKSAYQLVAVSMRAAATALKSA